MFESIQFQNFKALRNTTLPLRQFTLVVGPNGSGKSTALNAFLAMRQPNQRNFQQVRTAAVLETEVVALTAKWTEIRNEFMMRVQWTKNGVSGLTGQPVPPNSMGKLDSPLKCISGARLFSLDAGAIALPVQLQPQMELQPSGATLAGVLDRLRDQNPERFEALNNELMRWIPEFDRILFETPGPGQRSLALRTREGGYTIKAGELSQGTLIAIALLTIGYLPYPPSIVCLEEPDHGLHPRLLRDVRDALYRLAYPDRSQENREPVQVIATTHNPYF
ncbi:MAG: AAA family ATPase, partial [Limisphaerales bacterium]